MSDVTRPEQWRPVVGFEGVYEISDRGRLRSLHRMPAQIIQPHVGTNGYWLYVLNRAGRKYSRTAHGLVAGAFLGPRPEGYDIRHLNGDYLDPRAANLAYGTKSENTLDSVKHGTHHEARKTECPRGHAYDRANTRVNAAGKRKCRACERERNWARRRPNRTT